MPFEVRWDTTTVDSRDITIQEMIGIEKATGEPWSLANPYRSVTSATAFVAVAMLRHGVPDRDVEKLIDELRSESLMNCFSIISVPDEPEPSEEGDGEAASLMDLSPGESADSAGPPTKRGRKGSTTS